MKNKAFIKLIRHNKMWGFLEKHHPLGIVLIHHIARRISPIDDPKDNIKMGEALMSPRDVGISPGQYKRTMNKLEELGIIVRRVEKNKSYVSFADNSYIDLSDYKYIDKGRPTERPSESGHERPSEIEVGRPSENEVERPSENEVKRPSENEAKSDTFRPTQILLERPSEFIEARPSEKGLLRPSEKKFGDQHGDQPSFHLTRNIKKSSKKNHITAGAHVHAIKPKKVTNWEDDLKSLREEEKSTYNELKELLLTLQNKKIEWPKRMKLMYDKRNFILESFVNVSNSLQIENYKIQDVVGYKMKSRGLNGRNMGLWMDCIDKALVRFQMKNSQNKVEDRQKEFIELNEKENQKVKMDNEIMANILTMQNVEMSQHIEFLKNCDENKFSEIEREYRKNINLPPDIRFPHKKLLINQMALYLFDKKNKDTVKKYDNVLKKV